MSKHAYLILMHRQTGHLAYAIKVHWDWYWIEQGCESLTYRELFKKFKILDRGVGK